MTLPLESQNLLLRLLLQGVHSPQDLSEQSSIPYEQVREFLEEVGVPYGAGGFGMFPWPGSREENKKTGQNMYPTGGPRKVSKKGQVWWKGRHYGLGFEYARKRCWVQEEGNVLVVRFERMGEVRVGKKREA